MTKCKLTKLGKGMKAPKPALKAKAGDPAPGAFELFVNEDGTCHVNGVNDQGSVDISGVATLAVVSADPSVVSASLTSGMEFKESAVAVGDTIVTATATWNDGSVGPFSIDDGVHVKQLPPGPVTGLTISHDPPVVRP